MRVYLIYSTVDKIFDTTGNSGVNELYALTNDKKLFKLFKKQRKMSLFVVKTCEMTKDEYKEFGNIYREAVLQKTTYRSKKKDPYPENEYVSFGDCVDQYTIATTYLEAMVVNEELESFFLNASSYLDLPNPIIFSKSVRKILTRYGLDFIYKLKLFPDVSYGEDYYPDEDQAESNFQNPKMKYEDMALLRDIDSDMGQPDVWIDQMEVFLNKYGKLFDI